MSDFYWDGPAGITTIGDITIRPATLADSEFLWRLAMEPSVRENSTRSDAFTLEEHERWYREKLANPLCAMWVMEVEREPVAQVRYGKCVGAPWEAEIAISVMAPHRGYGLAARLLRETEWQAVQRLGVTRLVALVIVGNQSSAHLFEKSGYRHVGVEQRMGKRHWRMEKNV